MKITLSTHDESHHVSFTFKIWLHFIAPALVISLSMAAYLSYLSLEDVVDVVQTTTQADKALVVACEKSTDLYPQEVINTLARKLGVLEAESLRLNAFSSRLVAMAKLDPAEFAFDVEPSQGGSVAEHDSQVEDITAKALITSIEQLEHRLVAQQNRLQGVLYVINGRILKKQTKPSGMPVSGGYISSKFGFRHDPFTGKRRKHKGIDFAGKKGTIIKSVASGIVRFIGNKGAYGKVIEVDHGEGIISRYAHLNKIDVKAKQLVKKGQSIAKMGSTGRSTGSHLHLEILKNGVQQNPAIFFTKRRLSN